MSHGYPVCEGETRLLTDIYCVLTDMIFRRQIAAQLFTDDEWARESGDPHSCGVDVMPGAQAISCYAEVQYCTFTSLNLGFTSIATISTILS